RCVMCVWNNDTQAGVLLAAWYSTTSRLCRVTRKSGPRGPRPRSRRCILGQDGGAVVDSPKQKTLSTILVSVLRQACRPALGEFDLPPTCAEPFGPHVTPPPTLAMSSRPRRQVPPISEISADV